jgi:hypothetical protein
LPNGYFLIYSALKNGMPFDSSRDYNWMVVGWQLAVGRTVRNYNPKYLEDLVIKHILIPRYKPEGVGQLNVALPILKSPK